MSPPRYRPRGPRSGGDCLIQPRTRTKATRGAFGLNRRPLAYVVSVSARPATRSAARQRRSRRLPTNAPPPIARGDVGCVERHHLTAIPVFPGGRVRIRLRDVIEASLRPRARGRGRSPGPPRRGSPGGSRSRESLRASRRPGRACARGSTAPAGSATSYPQGGASAPVAPRPDQRPSARSRGEWGLRRSGLRGLPCCLFGISSHRFVPVPGPPLRSPATRS